MTYLNPKIKVLPIEKGFSKKGKVNQSLDNTQFTRCLETVFAVGDEI